jgi:hypothetical protein
MDVLWQRKNSAILFSTDNGAHIYPESWKWTHGKNIPQYIQVQHYFGLKGGA